MRIKVIGYRLSVIGERLKVKGLLGWMVLSIFIFHFSICQAQSNLTYALRVGANEKVALLDTCPEMIVGEKVNVKVIGYRLSVIGDGLSVIGDRPLALLDSLDFVMSQEGTEALRAWGDSVYSYSNEAEGTVTLWRSRREPRNRAQRVLVQNGRDTFESYVRTQTQEESHLVAWLGWILAGVMALALVVALVMEWRRRLAEKKLSSVEQEMLRRQRMGNRRHYGSQLYLWLLLLVLYAPIALIAVFSFTESKILGNWTGFSFDLYVNLFSGRADAGLNSAILYTVVIALVAAVVSTLLGTLAAIGIYNMRARQRRVVTLLNSVPMINPDIITGISLFLLFVALGMSQGLATVCIAHVVFCTPYVVLSVLPRLSRMNPNTYEAALDLGATPAQALRMVMLPELWPGMLSGFILALTLSVDDFGVTFFTKGSGGLETLSTFIYSDARKGGLTPELRPLFTIILLVMLTVLVVINIRAAKQENKHNF